MLGKNVEQRKQIIARLLEGDPYVIGTVTPCGVSYPGLHRIRDGKKSLFPCELEFLFLVGLP